MSLDSTDEHGADRRKKALCRIAGFADLDDEDIAHLKKLAGPGRQFKRGGEIRAEDDSPVSLHLLIDGWAASAINFADGSRQLTAVSLPGDILGLPTLAVADPIDSLVALNEVIVCDISVEKLADLFAVSPKLGMIMFLVSQEERSLAMERLALMGQSNALARLAALFVRLHERNAQIEDDAPLEFFMPLTQQEMGDLVGVTAVHVNALVKELRESGHAVIEDRMLRIRDLEPLLQIAGVAPWRRSKPNWLPKAL